MFLIQSYTWDKSCCGMHHIWPVSALYHGILPRSTHKISLPQTPPCQSVHLSVITINSLKIYLPQNKNMKKIYFCPWNSWICRPRLITMPSQRYVNTGKGTKKSYQVGQRAKNSNLWGKVEDMLMWLLSEGKLWRDLIETYKIITGKKEVAYSDFLFYLRCSWEESQEDR